MKRMMRMMRMMRMKRMMRITRPTLHEHHHPFPLFENAIAIEKAIENAIDG